MDSLLTIQIPREAARYPAPYALQVSNSLCRIWNDTLTLPLYTAALSALFLFLWALTRPRPKSDDPPTSWKDVEKYGGGSVLVHNILRFLASLALLGLSVVSFLLSEARKQADWQLQLGLCFFYLYASILAAAATAVHTRWAPASKRNLDLILLVAFGVYFYRDIFPFATYTWPVQDADEGRILHAKLVALTLAAVIIPLVTPQTYIPVDPTHPMPAPNPEQTASPLSLLFFSFLDTLVFLAYRLPHVPYDVLPPLADTDDAKNLKERSFPNIDTFSGAGTRHIFFGIIKTYQVEYASILVLLLVYVVCTFAAPIGINRVLAYLENGPGDSSVRPFVWIIWLALGPLASATVYHAYYRLSMCTLVQLEAVLTELIFEHALRVRVKARTPEAEAAEDDATAPDQKRTSARSSMDTGKISNLVTSDLQNVARMADFMMLLFGMPASVIFGIAFLYVVLGWSSLIGMATMLALFPVSGFTMKTIPAGLNRRRFYVRPRFKRGPV
ncbi:hypothetical protein B0H17DRAFT_1071043 [Mycena rosella]|uniref:ABC transmembrane type-1 domain-containing protein n=1 Tax=Mycena rosella TaxID=1033263 RepID=A0AAD7GFW6_MYCRO|nr:hypothetical protein B0H17DRAFT_1071043 [Mycena rosella]